MPEEITTQDAQYAWDIVNHICTQVGPGLPASPQEYRRAEFIRQELQAHLGAENVSVEEFSLAPDAFLGSQYITVLCMLVAVGLNISVERFTGISPWLTAIAALIFSICSILVFILEFVIGVELVDPFFKKKKSVNVVGALRKPAAQNVKRLLILSGHHDSALEFTWLRYTGYGFFISRCHLSAWIAQRAGDGPHPTGRVSRQRSRACPPGDDSAGQWGACSSHRW